MRKNFGAKPWTYPQPVYIIATYSDTGIPDAMNAAWGGISGSNQITLCLSPTHKTVKNLLKRKAFTISIADTAHVAACDYVGLESGNHVDNKFQKAGLHVLASQFVDAPLIEELPMALECELISYDETSHCLIGRIVNVCADERILDANGNIDPAKFDPILFDPIHNSYLKVGEKVGTAYKDGLLLK